MQLPQSMIRRPMHIRSRATQVLPPDELLAFYEERAVGPAMCPAVASPVDVPESGF
jgi:hypothetical protein